MKNVIKISVIAIMMVIATNTFASNELLTLPADNTHVSTITVPMPTETTGLAPGYYEARLLPQDETKADNDRGTKDNDGFTGADHIDAGQVDRNWRVLAVEIKVPNGKGGFTWELNCAAMESGKASYALTYLGTGGREVKLTVKIYPKPCFWDHGMGTNAEVVGNRTDTGVSF